MKNNFSIELKSLYLFKTIFNKIIMNERYRGKSITIFKIQLIKYFNYTSE